MLMADDGMHVPMQKLHQNVQKKGFLRAFPCVLLALPLSLWLPHAMLITAAALVAATSLYRHTKSPFLQLYQIKSPTHEAQAPSAAQASTPGLPGAPGAGAHPPSPLPPPLSLQNLPCSQHSCL